MHARKYQTKYHDKNIFTTTPRTKYWKKHNPKNIEGQDHEMGGGGQGQQGHIFMLWDPQNNWDLLRPPQTRASIRLRTIVGKKNGKKHRYYFRLATLFKGVHDLRLNHHAVYCIQLYIFIYKIKIFKTKLKVSKYMPDYIAPNEKLK